MALLFMPEVKIKEIVDIILRFIRLDCENNTGEDRILYQLLNGLKIDKFDFYLQSVEIFNTRNSVHQKKLECFNFFNAERLGVPTIHIVSPDENDYLRGIGLNEGVVDEVVAADFTKKQVFTKSSQSRIVLIITSESTYEVITIFHVLRSLLLSLFNDLQFAGFQDIRISGGDLHINPEMIPQNIFIKSINLDFFYDFHAMQLFSAETYSDLLIQGTPEPSIEVEEESSSS